MFKRPALAVVGDSSSGRDRVALKAAIAARDAARQAVIEARETLERLQAIIDQADDAARTAASATSKAGETRKAWVRNGCTYSATRELQGLDDAAAEAARTAQSAALNADAVRKQFGRAEEAVKSKENDIQRCEEEITAAISVILAQEAAPLLERFEQLAEEYRGLRAQIMGLDLALTPPWRLENKNRILPTAAAAELVANAMERASIRSWHAERESARAIDFVRGHVGRDEATLEELAARWRDRAAALRRDPDA